MVYIVLQAGVDTFALEEAIQVRDTATASPNLGPISSHIRHRRRVNNSV